MPEIKLQNSEYKRRWNWTHIQAKLFHTQIKSMAISQYQDAGALFINQLKDILIAFVAAKSVIDGQMTLGMMVAVQYIVGQVNAPLNQLVNFIRSAQDAKISLERLGEIHNQDDEEEQKSLKTSFIPPADIVIKNLSFSYTPISETVLNDINLIIPRGKITAIVGASGSGKTTLIKLLLGFYQPTYGSIKIGDTPLQTIHNSIWRDQCGAVLQDGYLFSDTIANNIAESDDAVDQVKLMRSVKTANIQEFVESMPLRYHTMIGAKGNGVSQGQRQRIFIARAVYKDPEFIFFDEATNSLDANNERIIMNNLNEFFEGRTVIVVAHRLSTVQHADQIVVLDQGSIVEQGNHQELVQRRGAYYTLVKNQLELAINLFVKNEGKIILDMSIRPDIEHVHLPEEEYINRQDEVQEILGHPPGWMLRWGISLVFIGVAAMIGLSYLIKYPDIVTATAEITTQNPPIPIVAKVSGEIDSILMADKITVVKDQVIGIIKSPVNIQDLDELELFFNSYHATSYTPDFLTLKIPKQLKLGELQNSYSGLIQQYEGFIHFLKQNTVFVQIQSLEKEINQILRLNNSLANQQDLLEKHMSYTQKDVERYASLNEDGVTSDQEREQKESELIQEERELENFSTNRINNDVRIQQLKTQINSLKSERRSELSQNQLNISQRISELKGRIAQWREQYIITAPIDGTLSYAGIWSENQSFSLGQSLFSVIPHTGDNKIIARCALPISGSGRVKSTNKINIQLDAYPYQEYGVLSAQAGAISLMPISIGQDESGQALQVYIIEVELPDTLITTYQKTIPFKQEMKGSAQIITEDRRIIHRIFDKILSILKN